MQSIFANNYLFDSVHGASPNQINNLKNPPVSQFSNVNTFDWPSSSSSSYNKAEMTDVLTASFTNIIDTQIYTGLESTTN